MENDGGRIAKACSTHDILDLSFGHYKQNFTTSDSVLYRTFCNAHAQVKCSPDNIWFWINVIFFMFCKLPISEKHIIFFYKQTTSNTLIILTCVICNECYIRMFRGKFCFDEYIFLSTQTQIWWNTYVIKWANLLLFYIKLGNIFLYLFNVLIFMCSPVINCKRSWTLSPGTLFDRPIFIVLVWNVMKKLI